MEDDEERAFFTKIRFSSLLKWLRRSVNPRRVMDLGSGSQLP